MISLIRVDDRDSAISYSNINAQVQWELLGNPDFEFDGTTSAPIAQGATATFSFKGTSVEVYGTLSASVGKTTVQYFINDQIVASNVNYSSVKTVLYRQLLFQHSSVEVPSHNITIQFTNEAPAGIFLDYFQYTPIDLIGSTVTTTSTVTMLPSTLSSPVSSTHEDSGCSSWRLKRSQWTIAFVYAIIALSLF